MSMDPIDYGPEMGEQGDLDRHGSQNYPEGCPPAPPVAASEKQEAPERCPECGLFNGHLVCPRWMEEQVALAPTEPVESEPVAWEWRLTQAAFDQLKDKEGETEDFWKNCSKDHASSMKDYDGTMEVRPLYTHPVESEPVKLADLWGKLDAKDFTDHKESHVEPKGAREGWATEVRVWNAFMAGWTECANAAGIEVNEKEGEVKLDEYCTALASQPAATEERGKNEE